MKFNQLIEFYIKRVESHMCLLKSFYSAHIFIDHFQPNNSKTNLNSAIVRQEKSFQDVRKSRQLTSRTCSKNFYDNLHLLFDKVVQNQKMINCLENKIDQGIQKMDQTSLLENSLGEKQTKNNEAIKIENFHEILQTDSETAKSESLQQKLFGRKEYPFRIQVEGQFPVQMLKERNISFSVKLYSSSGSIIKNRNPIKVNLGVCDNKGNWITSSSQGADFMKGNCEIEIHHGVGEFRKIYPRDISRGFVDHQVNFVIYPQPSTIQYMDSMNQWEAYVDPMDVQPLLIEKISIRAKKVHK